MLAVDDDAKRLDLTADQRLAVTKLPEPERKAVLAAKTPEQAAETLEGRPLRPYAAWASPSKIAGTGGVSRLLRLSTTSRPSVTSFSRARHSWSRHGTKSVFAAP